VYVGAGFSRPGVYVGAGFSRPGVYVGAGFSRPQGHLKSWAPTHQLR